MFSEVFLFDTILNLICNVYQRQFPKNDKTFTKIETPFRKPLTWQTSKNNPQNSILKLLTVCRLLNSTNETNSFWISFCLFERIFNEAKETG